MFVLPHLTNKTFNFQRDFSQILSEQIFYQKSCEEIHYDDAIIL